MRAAARTSLQSSQSRFLNVLGCAADLNEFDTQSGKLLRTLDLANRTKLIPTRGTFSDSIVDGCATYGAVYASDRGLMYTLSPTAGTQDENLKQHLRLLSFKLPGLELSGFTLIPTALPLNPVLRLSASGEPEILSDGHKYLFTGTRIVAAGLASPGSISIPGSRTSKTGTEFPELNLRLYTMRNNPDKLGDTLTYEPLEEASGFLLARVYTTVGETHFAVINPGLMSVTFLASTVSSTEKCAHLMPGGRSVLVQEAYFGEKSSPVPDTTGKMQLIDAASGKVQQTWTDPLAAHYYFLIMTPGGKMLLYSGGKYQLLPAFGSYPIEAVENLVEPTIQSSFFYAGK